jgi:hypothetical protein
LNSGYSAPETINAARHTQHIFSVKCEIATLALRERTDVNAVFGIDAHALQRSLIGNWRHDQLARVLEGNEAHIEEMVHRRHQQEPIFAIEPLLVAAVAPRLYVARDQMLHSFDIGDAAGTLYGSYIVPE